MIVIVLFIKRAGELWIITKFVVGAANFIMSILNVKKNKGV